MTAMIFHLFKICIVLHGFLQIFPKTNFLVLLSFHENFLDNLLKMKLHSVTRPLINLEATSRRLGSPTQIFEILRKVSIHWRPFFSRCFASIVKVTQKNMFIISRCKMYVLAHFTFFPTHPP